VWRSGLYRRAEGGTKQFRRPVGSPTKLIPDPIQNGRAKYDLVLPVRQAGQSVGDVGRPLLYGRPLVLLEDGVQVRMNRPE